ncbi:Chromosome transmission fidelity protein 18 [Nakaseomyces glabratus]|uniref:Chromosome transmission fidelity protein 18 n=1 Tax=Candida glabrata TaxID=5478 RepID=A0A0W0CDL4_CANGB|nr:Chromosome transmission fidelity protein 18 [Nakaseomyces glabratus]KTB01378.1 Chromosome transmission fidelity protein 18 [Nakaseomyces glabratus]KTB03719.1 Chromosome transmission fidelity protein 18 [Nakaseomyces glabratus]KTB18129.1 Chromosome transmission fidelity protein 18 [Nakaseomyces glabratus]
MDGAPNFSGFGGSVLFGDEGEKLVFNGCKGGSVVLEKRASANATATTSAGITYNSAVWQAEDGYGINIAHLIDRIEARSDDSSGETARAETVSGQRSPDCTLWVEKWRPKKFMDLVGNEKNNRRILKWLRQWNFAVFKEQLPQPDQSKEQENFDPFERPMKRILMLNGPPGIGKTSVAHVVAKQAGFSVAEINASDERAGTLVRDKVHNTLFNHSFTGEPVCLIADEIDGSVESGFVKVLIDIVNADKRATDNYVLKKNARGKNNGKSNRYRPKLLLRPIIVICNNLYAPALEKLRPLCEIITLRKPSDNSVRERLTHICMKERINSGMKTINELIDISEGDIRNCVNNLQFQSKGNHKTSNNDNVSEDTLGLKDISLSWFKIVNQIFRKDPHLDNKRQFIRLARKIEKVDNYDRVVTGCHTLFPHVKYSDSGLRKPAAIADWLYFHEQMFKSMFEHNGELLRYCAIVPMVFHQKFGDISNKDDQRIKNADYEQREARKAVESITESIMKKLSTFSPLLASNMNKKDLGFEILPYLDSMIASDISKIKDAKKKQAVLNNIINLIDLFQLELLETRGEHYTSRGVLMIEPPIDKVVLIDEMKKNEVTTKRAANLNLILAKQEEIKVRKRHLNQVEANKGKSTVEETTSKRQKISIENFSKANNDKTVDMLKSQYTAIQQNTTDQNKSTNNESEEVKIWIKYKEGFSDAVRKKVTWETLWS